MRLKYEPSSEPLHISPPIIFERIRQIQDSQDQILVLALRWKSFKPYMLISLRLRAAQPYTLDPPAKPLCQSDPHPTCWVVVRYCNGYPCNTLRVDSIIDIEY